MNNQQNYEPWTDTADNELRRLVGSGQSINELASHFGRSEGTISSRINAAKLQPRKQSPKTLIVKPLNNITMINKKKDLYDHPDHGRVRMHYATRLEISEDGQFISKTYSDSHTGNTKSFSPDILEDTSGRSYINWSDKKVYVDEMVCSCFHGKRKDGQMAIPVHIYGDLTNNHANNLRWQ